MPTVMQAWNVQTTAHAMAVRGLGRWPVSEWKREDTERAEARRRRREWRGGGREGEGVVEVSLERRRKERGRRSARRVRLSVWNVCFSVRRRLRVG